MAVFHLRQVLNKYMELGGQILLPPINKFYLQNCEQAIIHIYHPVSQPQTITASGSQFSFIYDDFGRKTSETNPNSGTTSFEYDYLGRIVKKTDSRNIVSQTKYNRAGRATWTGENGVNINYSYYTSGKNKGKVEKIAGDNNIARVFRYDDLGKVKRLADSIQGEVSMVTRYGYDAWSHNTTITYPSGIVFTNVYDTKGYVSQINNGSSILWKMNSADSR